MGEAAWEPLLRGLLESGDAHLAKDRDLLVCVECRGAPHAHRPLCPVLRVPVHVDDSQGREVSLGFWRYWTGGLRPLWIHHGMLGEGDRDHQVDGPTPPCWCRPEIVDPDRRIGVG